MAKKRDKRSEKQVEKIFGPTVTEDDISKELRIRSSTLEKKTITASRMDLARKKEKIEIEDGWKRSRLNKKSIVMSRPKPFDEQLEDEIWCIAARMGFKELSSGRQFLLETKHDPNPRQIDIFAKDEETAIVFECTQAAEPTTSSKAKVNDLIQNISDFKGRISSEITQKYGREGKIKPKFVIATRRIGWGSADIEKCNQEGIGILTDSEIDYYTALTTYLKSAARYQFLAHLFEGVEVPGLAKTVPATKGRMGKTNFYNFIIEPKDLLKISYVGHKSSRTVDSIATYQRMLQPRRLNSIAKYINDGGKFPTNIVVNIKTTRNRPLVFDATTKIGEAEVGTLKLPDNYGSAWIIDGQHRLYGYAYRDTKDVPKSDKSVLPVLAFENLPAEDEMNMFIDINSKQVKVKTSLLIELYADLHWNSPNSPEKLLALHARIVSNLNTKKTSPICDRVAIVGKGKTSFRCLTSTSISDGIKVSQLLGKISRGILEPGPLSFKDPENLQESLEKAASVISDTLTIFSNAVPAHWESGDKPGIGYLCTNIGIRSLLLVLMDICRHISIKHDENLSAWPPEQIMDQVRDYIAPAVEFFQAASIDEIQAFRRIGSSLAAVTQQSLGMDVFIHEKFAEYKPDGLIEYIKTRDHQGNQKALLKVNAIQKTIFDYVKSTLNEMHGEQWWAKGVSTKIRKECNVPWEDEERSKPEGSYLLLRHYQDIVLHDWKQFKDVFSLGNKDKDNGVKCTKWIIELNNIRNKTHHPEKGSLTMPELTRVDEISELVTEFLNPTEK